MIENGTFTCANNILDVQFHDDSSTARIDPERNVLIWGEVEFEQVE